MSGWLKLFWISHFAASGIKKKIGFMIKGEFYKNLLHSFKWCESKILILNVKNQLTLLFPHPLSYWFGSALFVFIIEFNQNAVENTDYFFGGCIEIK